jgi:hypothetical protein
MSYSGSVIVERTFKWLLPIFAFLWLSPLWSGPCPLFEQFRIPFTQGLIIPSLIEIGMLILQIIFSINTCKYGSPYCGPSWCRGPWYEQFWIYIISDSFRVNMTYHGSVVVKKILKWSHPIFAFFVIISHLKKAWPFIWKI